MVVGVLECLFCNEPANTEICTDRHTLSLHDALPIYKLHGVDEAIKLAKDNATAKFDETIEIALNLGVDPRHADQMVRGVVTLPKGTGKTVRVGVFARGAKADEAREAGADVVGAEDLMEIIQGGTIDFDRCIATPDMMGVVGRLGKVLGPKGLMPNPKLGTVTMDVAAAVKAAKGGQVEYRVEKRSEEHTSELQSLMRISYAVFCLKKKTHTKHKVRQVN